MLPSFIAAAIVLVTILGLYKLFSDEKVIQKVFSLQKRWIPNLFPWKSLTEFRVTIKLLARIFLVSLLGLWLFMLFHAN